MTAGRVVSPDLSPEREKTLTRGRAAMVDQYVVLCEIATNNRKGVGSLDACTTRTVSVQAKNLPSY